MRSWYLRYSCTSPANALTVRIAPIYMEDADTHIERERVREGESQRGREGERGRERERGRGREAERGGRERVRERASGRETERRVRRV